MSSKKPAWEDNFPQTQGGAQDDAVMPIAIVGVGGRYPGDASNPQKLWDLIAQGKSALSEIPKDRFNIDAFYHPHNERQGTLNVRGAHFMEGDVSAFDAPFFSMTPAEAKAMDPQQRMALECTYEALENAGIRMEDVVGSNTSCYVGCFTRDYSDMLACDREDLPLYHGTGTGSAIMSNRVSWFFDMKGPSISLDTACSSSLVALHLGCQSLRTGESEMSVVGGTNLILLPDIMGAMTKLHFLSPDGKCQSFDHKANGYARGEGAAFVVLKPLHLAIKNHDVIRGVIRNTAVNQDGNTPGITLPSEVAQEALIRKIYSEAGLSLADTAYVEAHGTGTPAGDPVETGALASTFGKSRAPGDPLYIGSIKSNIGHLEGGSGLAQLTKAILMLEKGEIPPNVWFEKPNPRIPLDEWNLKVPVELTRWPTDGLRRLSINSFGYGGTNAHCIIDDAYHYMKARRIRGNHNTTKTLGDASPASSTDSGVDMSSAELVTLNLGLQGAALATWESLSGFENTVLRNLPPSPKILIWSSHEQVGVERTSMLYSEYLASKLTEDLDKLDERSLFTKFAHTLAARRSILPWKAFEIASSCKEACENLKAPTVKPLRSAKAPKLGFIFTGQGAQWFAMGHELCAHQVFKESLEAASGYLVSIGSTWSLLVELCRDEKSSNLNSASLSQPICTALQVALVDLLRHWNIVPAAVVGHSSGEIAAAYAKGAITREAAWSISYHRGRLSSNIRGFAPNLKGSMLATGVGPQDAQAYIDRVTDGNATIACINSPSSTTISGDSNAIASVEAMIKADDLFARRLKVDTAYHSPHMQVIAESYLDSLKNIRTNSDDGKNIKMFSSVTGKLIENSELGASYWVTNMLNQVNFAGAVRSLLDHSDSKTKRKAVKSYVDILVEIGPHSALQGPLKQILAVSLTKAEAVSYVSVLQRGNDACLTALDTVGRLFQRGYPVNISAANNDENVPGKDGFVVDIPPFAWNRNAKYWFESHSAKAHRFRKQPRKDLFGSATLEDVPGEPRYRNILKLVETPWVEFHKVQGSILYPAAGMMITAIEAAMQNADPTQQIDGFELRDVLIGKAIVVPQDEAGVETMLSFKPWRLGSQSLNSVWQEFNLFSRQEVWELNCSGLICIKYKTNTNALFEDEETVAGKLYSQKYREVSEQCTRTLNPRQFYEHLTTIGLYYGDVFQNVTEIKKGDFKSRCTIKVPDTKSVMPHNFEYPHVIHPATLDSIIQMALPACSAIDEELKEAVVPTSIGRLFVSVDCPSTPGTLLSGYAIAANVSVGDGEASVVVSNAAWDKPLVIFEGVKSTALSGPADNSASLLHLRKLTSFFQWKEDVSMLESGKLKTLCVKAVGDMGQVDPIIHQELELASFIYIKRVLKACSPEEATKFAPHLQLFYQFMQNAYERARLGTLVYQSDKIDWMDMSREFEDALLARVSQATTDGAVMYEHGENLIKIMRGEIPPLQVLMKDNRLHNFYSSGLGCGQHYAQAVYYIDLLAHKNPNMKILEIGGGTAAATLPILEALGGHNGSSPRFSNYTFTDISVGFFEKAKEKLKAWSPFMTFAKYNIEEDPIQQGFEEGGYDMIVASNVLHATRFMNETLANTKKLLKPNGKLVLSEITNSMQKLRETMIVGSLEGWWLGEEDGRHFGPTLTDDEWNASLIRTGFSGVDVAFHDFPEPEDQMLSVMISTASPPEADPIPQDILIVVPAMPSEEVTKFSTKVAENLKTRSAQVAIAKLQDTVSIDIEKKSCLVLLDVEKDSPFLPEVNEKNWDALKRVILDSADITYVTRGGTVNSENPSTNLMSGMARSIRSENPSLALGTLDLDYTKTLDTKETIAATIKVFVAIANSKDSAKPDWEYAVRNGRAMVQRILLEQGMNDLIATYNVTPKPEEAPFKQEGRPLTLQVGTPGRLDTLRFIDDKSCEAPLEFDDVEIEVRGAGLNFKDVMVAMGQLFEPSLGVDCSGIVSRVGSGVTRFSTGDRVMTWRRGTFGNFTRTSEAMVQLIPDGMSFGTAASLPVVYCTAYHAIFDAGRLQKEENILIHGAAGGVGQAAIILAQYVGAEVFATVSSEAKKQLLMQNYNIPEDHIFNSRDNSFVKGVMRSTKQRGVNVILNSLAGEALRESWHCIAWFGRFLEMGQKDIVGNTGLDMAPFIKNVSFHSINMLGILDHDPANASRIFKAVLDLLRQKVAKPISPVTTMPFSRVEEAFRLMQTGKHMGKIVLEADDNDIVSVIPPSIALIRFDPKATYILAGGSGGLGRCLAEWMVASGARNIVLLTRSGSLKPTVRSLLDRLSKQGAKVAAYPCDVSDEEDMERTLARCTKEFPPIRGVIQGAMVLRDAIFQNMTHEQFMGAARCKVQGSWNLHQYLPKDLDFFVLLSSSVGIAGSRAQGNYSAGNAYQDALAHYRRGLGLKACSIDVGMVLGVGFLVEETTADRVYENTKSWSFIGIREQEFLALVQASITGKSIHGQNLPPQIITGLGTGGMMAQGSEKYPWWFNDAKFAHIVQVDTHQVIQDKDEDTAQLQALLLQATSMDQATDIVSSALVKKLAKSMMVAIEDIEASRPVSSYGVDSLLAVELRSWLYSEVQADISVFDLLSNIPISALARRIVAKSKCVPASLIETE